MEKRMKVRRERGSSEGRRAGKKIKTSRCSVQQRQQRRRYKGQYSLEVSRVEDKEQKVQWTLRIGEHERIKKRQETGIDYVGDFVNGLKRFEVSLKLLN